MGLKKSCLAGKEALAREVPGPTRPAADRDVDSRIIGIARENELHKKINIDSNTDCAVEFYRRCSRFITISAMQIGGTGSDYPALPKTTGLPEYDALFDALYARYCDEQQRPRPKDCEFAGRLYLTVEPIEDKDELDFNDAGPQVVEFNYQDLIENGAPTGKRSEEVSACGVALGGLGLVGRTDRPGIS